jgi:hypothetical protein
MNKTRPFLLPLVAVALLVALQSGTQAQSISIARQPSVTTTTCAKLDAGALSGTPTSNSLANFVATGGTALGTKLGASSSLVDALGFNGVVKASASAGSLAYQAGSRFTVVSAVTSSSIPNGTITGGAITAASTTGILVLRSIVAQCDGTGWAGSGVTNFEFATDNVKGKTGAAAPLISVVKATFGATTTYSTGATDPLAVLETGKKIYVLGDAGAGTGAGICNVYLTFERGVDGATITAVSLP